MQNRFIARSQPCAALSVFVLDCFKLLPLFGQLLKNIPVAVLSPIQIQNRISCSFIQLKIVVFVVCASAATHLLPPATNFASQKGPIPMQMHICYQST